MFVFTLGEKIVLHSVITRFRKKNVIRQSDNRTSYTYWYVLFLRRGYEQFYTSTIVISQLFFCFIEVVITLMTSNFVLVVLFSDQLLLYSHLYFIFITYDVGNFLYFFVQVECFMFLLQKFDLHAFFQTLNFLLPPCIFL